MLIEFSVGNFTSFKEIVTLSLVAAKIRSKNKRLDIDNVFDIAKDLSLLRSAAIYGANASGKSNFIVAASFMRRFIRESFKEAPDATIPVDLFRLSTETETKPSYFEMVFILEGQQYRYGFEVDRQAVQSEWLYSVPHSREVKIFERQGLEVIPNPSNIQAKEFRAVLAQQMRINANQPLRSNALFLSTVALNNGPYAAKIVNWFSGMRFMSGLDDSFFRHFTIEMYAKPEMRERILEMVHSLDVDITDIVLSQQTREEALRDAPDILREFISKIDENNFYEITTRHAKYNQVGDIVGYETMDLESDESAGTRKLFFMTGPIIDTLQNGRILWVDEMEARLHPKMTDAIVGLFNNSDYNPLGAQLIFTTHDTNLLNVNKLRRDQVWFMEKDRLAASQLFSLVEYKIRNDDASLEQDYISGRFGAVPHIGELMSGYEAGPK